jgi:SNF2 family DNA or RNA helicase
MLDIISLIRSHLWPKIWNRSLEYKKTSEITAFHEEDDFYEIEWIVTGSEDYDTSVWISRTDNTVRGDCSCMAFQDAGICKHLGWLARRAEASGYKFYKKGESESTVENNLELPKSPTTQTHSNKTNTPKYISVGKYEVDQYFYEYLIWGMPIEMLQYIMADENYFEFIVEEVLKESNNHYLHDGSIRLRNSKALPPLEISPLDQLKSIKNTESKNSKYPDIWLYRIKLETDTIRWNNYLLLNLYKSKLLKNGSLSTGKEVFAEDEDIVAAEWLLPFMWEKYKSYSRRKRLTFNTSPELFIHVLLEHQFPITTLENKPLSIQKTETEIRFSITKKDTNYKIQLCYFEWTAKQILSSWTPIFSFHGNYLAIFMKEKVVFTKYSISKELIITLLKSPITLSQDEWEKFKSQKSFFDLISESADVDFLEDEGTLGNPKALLQVEIAPDYSQVLATPMLQYDSISVPTNTSQSFLVNPKNTIIRRDISKEKEILSSFSSLKKLADTSKSDIFRKTIDSQSDEFFDEIESLVANGIKVEYKQPFKRVQSNSLSAKISVKNGGNDWFDASVEFMLDSEKLENIEEILTALKHAPSSRYITLDNWTVIRLKDDAKKALATLDDFWITEKNISKGIRMSKYHIWMLESDKKNGFLEFKLAKNIAELKKSLQHFTGIPEIPLPSTSKVIPRSYQKQGYDWLHFLKSYNFSGILADDMGLGKTIQTLLLLQSMYEQNPNTPPTLIIVPTSLVFNWKDEAKKFVPDLLVDYIPDSKTLTLLDSKSIQVIIVSYGVLANLVKLQEGFVQKTWEYIILDEAQNIKNHTTERAQAVRQLTGNHRLALTGTPIENNILELYSIFQFLMPGFLGSERGFKNRFLSDDSNMIVSLAKKVTPFILRRKKEEVLTDLPEKQEELILLEMDASQKKFYEGLKTTFYAQITKKIESDGINKSQIVVLDALLKLRQACLSPRLVKIASDKQVDSSIKLEYLNENLEEIVQSGHNVLIFSQFTEFLWLIRETLTKNNLSYSYLDGTMSREKRQKAVDEFNSRKTSIFLLSLKAWGTGLNLTSADYVIHIDPWWNPAVENQATDRAHRMGQKRSVFVKKLIVKDTVEEKICALQDKKRALVENLFDGNFSGGLTMEDIGFIFE